MTRWNTWNQRCCSTWGFCWFLLIHQEYKDWTLTNWRRWGYWFVRIWYENLVRNRVNRCSPLAKAEEDAVNRWQMALFPPVFLELWALGASMRSMHVLVTPIVGEPHWLLMSQPRRGDAWEKDAQALQLVRSFPPGGDTIVTGARGRRRWQGDTCHSWRSSSPAFNPLAKGWRCEGGDVAEVLVGAGCPTHPMLLHLRNQTGTKQRIPKNNW